MSSSRFCSPSVAPVAPLRPLAAALVALALFGGLAGEVHAETVEVTASGLNVRSGPSTRYRVVTVIRKGQRFTVRGRSGNWVRLSSGYAYGSYLRTVASSSSSSSSSSAYTVTASALNVRTGPSTRYRVLGTVRRGQRVDVTGTSGAWKRIRYSGRTAYVHGAYVSRGGGSAAPAPAPSRRKSRAGFIQLAASGPGFYGYSISSGRWGIPNLIYGMERVGRRWVSQRAPRMGVGHISKENGQYFFPHVSHRSGKDADVRPVRDDGAEAPTTIYSGSYSRTLTQRLINLYRAEMSERTILFNDSRVSGRRYWPGHHNHFHFSHR